MKNILIIRGITSRWLSWDTSMVSWNVLFIFNKPEPHVEKEEAEIAMISMPDTVANEHTMMLPL